MTNNMRLKWQDITQLAEVTPNAIETLACIMGISPRDFVQSVKNGEVFFDRCDRHNHDLPAAIAACPHRQSYGVLSHDRPNTA